MSQKRTRVLSGITPSSSNGLHIGNYLGAVQPHLEFQSADERECFYFIADYHALNTVHDPKEFRQNVIDTYLDYLALGIDLSATTFFIESHVREIVELTEIINNVVTLAQMKRMHAYKDKLADPDADIDSINMGLFNYPILMAADILVFEPDIVPVGEDQAQHVEIARDIAKSFNHRYNQDENIQLKVPELYIKDGVGRIKGTDGERKMSKSLGNDLTIFASEERITEQVNSIKTDENRIHKDDPGDPEKNTVFYYMHLMGFDPEMLQDYEDRYRKGTIGDREIKAEFTKFFIEYFAEARKRRAEFAKDSDQLIKLMQENGEKATAVAEQTMKKVKDMIGAI